VLWPFGIWASGEFDLSGTQMTVSEGHPWPPPQGAAVTDRGGPFYTTKSYVAGNPTRHVKAVKVDPPSHLTFTLSGPVICYYPRDINGKLAFPAPSSSSDHDLEVLGATAISRCEPTNSVANASTFLGELVKDKLPALPGVHTWEQRVRAAQAAGDEFLNVAFGWLPFVDDVTDLGNAVKHADTVLAQYERDSGRLVRRRYNFPSVHETTEEVVALNRYPLYAGGATAAVDNAPHSGFVSRKVETSRKQWFSGAFTYYIPSDYDSRKALAGDAAEAEKLLGSPLSPDVVWELTPWSWAIDWFSNTGDVIHNIGAFAQHGLVMPYGYMMEHTITKHTYRLFGGGLGDQIETVTPDLVLVTETKKRIQANPYGFGVSWDGLSSFQTAVLAALGISRRS